MSAADAPNRDSTSFALEAYLDVVTCCVFLLWCIGVSSGETFLGGSGHCPVCAVETHADMLHHAQSSTCGEFSSIRARVHGEPSEAAGVDAPRPKEIGLLSRLLWLPAASGGGGGRPSPRRVPRGAHSAARTSSAAREPSDPSETHPPTGQLRGTRV